MNRDLLQEYHKEWVEKFTQEALKIKDAFGSSVKDIQHIGSTSIPGMWAKPIIDIGVLVNSIDDVTFFVNKPESAGYSYKPGMSSSERIFLRKGDPVEYHLSITSPKHTFWHRQIAFRDCLKSNPELVEEYNELKLNNVSKTPDEDFSDLSRSRTYNAGKGEFVIKVLALAEDSKN